MWTLLLLTWLTLPPVASGTQAVEEGWVLLLPRQYGAE